LRYLLDTNVLSETAKDVPDSSVIQWVSEHLGDDLLISSITVGEISYGIEKLEEGRRKAEYRDWFESVLLEWFAGNIVPLDEEVMLAWAWMRVASRSLPVLDSLIAAAAISSNSTLVTRNTRDFEGIPGIRLFNPWPPETQPNDKQSI
jgi:predicted nucleic acid-binding protein